MKYLSIPILLFLLLSCGESEPKTSTNSNEEVPEVIEDVLADLTLNAEESTIDWKRFLDQKATKKKVKLFGAMVDMELGPVKMNMNGNVTPIKGGMLTTNDVCTSGNLIFDMATFKFAEEKGQGLFNLNDYPESELVFNSFEAIAGDTVNSYNVTMMLIIQDHEEEIVAPISIQTNAISATIKGQFTFNTLDFPLRDKIKRSEVNKDEITVLFDLLYEVQ